MKTELLESISKAIYWYGFTPKQEKAINGIISDPETNNMGKANDICDYLGIERRGNRSAIYEVLNKQEASNE